MAISIPSLKDVTTCAYIKSSDAYHICHEPTKKAIMFVASVQQDIRFLRTRFLRTERRMIFLMGARSDFWEKSDSAPCIGLG